MDVDVDVDVDADKRRTIPTNQITDPFDNRDYIRNTRYKYLF